MSLINHMLRELDRRAQPATASVAPLAAVAAIEPTRRRRLVVAAVLGVLAAGMALPFHGSTFIARADAAGLPASTPPTTQPAAAPLAAAASATTTIAAGNGAANAASPATHVAALQPAASAPRRASALRPMPPTRIASIEQPPATTAPASRIEKLMPTAKPLERADAAYRRGVVAHESGDYPEAERAYAAALKDHAALAAARVGLAGVFIAQRRLGEAEALLQAGLRLDAQQAMLAQPFARLLADRGELAAAIEAMQVALAHGAGDAGYRACLGALLQRAGRQHEAAEHFDAALRLDPSQGAWWIGLAIALAAEGRADAARTAYARARSTGTLTPELANYVEQRLQRPL